MAKFVSTQASVSINGEDVSDACARAELTIDSAVIETTDFGSGGFVENIGGLKSGTVSLDFHHDYAVGAVSDLLKDATGTIGTVVVIPNGTTASAENPSWTAEVVVNSFAPVSGAVGDLSTFSVSYPTTGEITFATA